MNIDLNGNTFVRGYFSGIGEELTGLDASNLTTGTIPDARLSANVTLQGNTLNGPGGLIKLDATGSAMVSGTGTLTVGGLTVECRPGGNFVPFALSNAGNTSTSPLMTLTDWSGTSVGTNYPAILWTTSYTPQWQIIMLPGNSFSIRRDVGGYDALSFSNSTSAASSIATFAGTVVASAYAGTGSALTGLNASNLASGTLSDSRLSSNVPRLNVLNNSFVTNGGGNSNYLNCGNTDDAYPHFALINNNATQWVWQCQAGSEIMYIGCNGGNTVSCWATQSATNSRFITGGGNTFYDDGSSQFQVYNGSSLLFNVATNGNGIFLGNILTGTAGSTLAVKSGPNALAGTVSLSSGTATITSSAIDVNTVIILSLKTSSGIPGAYMPRTSVTSGSATVAGLSTDNSTYNWIGLKVN